jgi:hypothetical protein
MGMTPTPLEQLAAATLSSIDDATMNPLAGEARIRQFAPLAT